MGSNHLQHLFRPRQSKSVTGKAPPRETQAIVISKNHSIWRVDVAIRQWLSALHPTVVAGNAMPKAWLPGRLWWAEQRHLRGTEALCQPSLQPLGGLRLQSRSAVIITVRDCHGGFPDRGLLFACVHASLVSSLHAEASRVLIMLAGLPSWPKMPARRDLDDARLMATHAPARG